MNAKASSNNNPITTFDNKRDAYGFAVRPQHVQTYREYANIYKEEEEERSERWKSFLERQAQASDFPINGLAPEADNNPSPEDQGGRDDSRVEHDEDETRGETPPEDLPRKVEGAEVPIQKEQGACRIQIWTEVRPSLRAIEVMMSARVKRKSNTSKVKRSGEIGMINSPIEESGSPKGVTDEDSDDEFYDLEKSESSDAIQLQDSFSGDNYNVNTESVVDSDPVDSMVPWKEELEVLVHGGVPMALRGELWQAFVGVKVRRVENYYNDLLSRETSPDNHIGLQTMQSDSDFKGTAPDSGCLPEKWTGQIEKDLPRTFPGHPALDEDGRNALRRLLTAYARHNPSVGYCQAMNFFAGLLLLLMPEENAFWTLMGIIDDYFEGYYSEEMIESQVDQLVFEELVHEKFPRLVNHLDYLGVQIAWVTGPWFLSIFMNMLPWESVLRVWDVLLFEGNRVMLFRTALALMELYGPALVTTKDAGDAVTLLQSLAGSTFDSSQLVLTASMGYLTVNAKRLQDSRGKHRAAVLAALEERSKGLPAWRDSQGLASKLYGFMSDPKLMMEPNKAEPLADTPINGDTLEVKSTVIDANGDVEVDSVPVLQEQVIWLKVELCKLLEDKRSAILRAEELETALMEMVKQDNRRELSAKVEMLEQEAADLRRALSDKQEQENAMLQVLMRVEQEQRVTEDARRFAEQEAAAQRHTSQVLEEKYNKAAAALAEMEKRAVMAESMLEATLQYQSSQIKAQPSPRSTRQDSPGRSNQDNMPEIPMRKVSLLSRPFGLSWGDRNKPANPNEQNDVKESQSPRAELKETTDAEAPENEQSAVTENEKKRLSQET